jgi:hypothetical protein
MNMEGAVELFLCERRQSRRTKTRAMREQPGNVARAGIEPATFHFSGERYYRLSYLAWSR